MRIIEKALVLIAVFGLIVRLLGQPTGSIIMVMSLSSLSWLYVFLSFALLNGIKLRSLFKKGAFTCIPTWHKIGAVLSGIGLGIACIGILFKMQAWGGAQIELIEGLILCLIPAIIGLLKWRGRHKEFYNRVLSRTIIFVCLCLVFLCLPDLFFLRIYYRHNPTFINAVEQSRKDPENQQLRDKVDAERRKIMQNH